MEKRLLLAMVLSMAVLLLTPYLYQRFSPDPVPNLPSENAQEEVKHQNSRNENFASPALQERVPGKSPKVDTLLNPTAGRSRTIRIENDDMVLTWNSEGARLESVRLKGYGDELGNPVELLPQDISDSLPRPLQLSLDDEDLDLELAGALFEVQGALGGLAQAPAEVTFTYRSQHLQIEERVSVPREGHLVTIQARVELGGRPIAYSVFLGPGIGQVDSNVPATNDFMAPSLAYYSGGSVERHEVGDLTEGARRIETSADWVAVDSKYFTYLLFAPNEIRAARLGTVSSQQGDESEKDERVLLVGGAEFKGDARYSLFLGPKNQEVLAMVDSSLPALIDYGWFDVLVRPLIYCLRLSYSYVGNYGLSIIILTFLINLALFPVRYKQIVSMKKMSELQPKIRSMQDRYKRMKRDDPRRQQQQAEMMGIYKQHGVNPLGGCLPLVFQMPFLFAFYRMLDSSIELRGAPFVGWIQDLSRHDPYYITPIVMGASMVVQQRMTPTTGDPSQARMMMFLPVVFVFFFLNLSSGLVVYFLFSNLFAMMFQVLMQKWQPELATANKVSVRKAGARKK